MTHILNVLLWFQEASQEKILLRTVKGTHILLWRAEYITIKRYFEGENQNIE